ncbi:MAG: hypothetical protein CL840_02190 [Crocinitomicaceae bacterium]|nr:hypothetical protein [Crocinitomicaceae bacterium]
MGLALIIYGFANDQLPLFMLGAFAFLIVGVIATLSSLDIFSKGVRTIILFVMMAFSVVLIWLDYKAIKDPLDFQKEKQRRYQYVIQNLKDLRQAQMAYKSQYGKYLGSMDSLMDFINNDSILLIVSNGTVPDGMTQTQAIDSGYLAIDTSKAPAATTIFDQKYLSDRKVPFSLDSLAYVPFSTSMFTVEASIIERGKVKVPVFLITDAAPYDEMDVMMVGSLVDPTTAGNWGE